MNNKRQSEELDIPRAIASLLAKQNSVQLATLNANNQPEASYSPYLLHDDKVYIFISELAAHTQNLKLNPQASLLFIEDEYEAKNIFARKRLILNCEANIISREQAQWTTVITQFEHAHGNTVALLKTLPDFLLFELTSQSGSYIQGFGQAYGFEGMNFTKALQVTGK